MQHLMRSAALLHYDEYATRLGLDPRRMFARAGIAPGYLDEPDLFLPYEQFVELLEDSAQSSGNPLFGAELGLLQGLDILGPIAYLVRSSDTVADALNGLARYFHLHNRGARVKVEVFGRIGVASYEMHTSSSVPTRQAVELAVAIGYKMLRMLAGSSLVIRECVFQHERLAGPKAYRRVFGCVPRFNGEYNGYELDASLLERPLASADKALHALMKHQLTAMEARVDDSLTARVEAQIRSALPAGDVSLELVAGRLATSDRSLQRNLQQEGTNFQAVLDKVRRELAEHYLRDSSLQLTQIAQLLAYGDLSNLTRAFRRWHDTSPRSWRTVHRRVPARRPAAVTNTRY
jgi:AraC-like DNA-binding protein